MKEILNPNTSGQGLVPSHIEHPLYPVVIEFGYAYSHSVYIHDGSGAKSHLYHCYKHTGHNVTLMESAVHQCPMQIWQTSCGNASGHQWDGRGEPELRAHLSSKSRRYNLRKP